MNNDAVLALLGQEIGALVVRVALFNVENERLRAVVREYEERLRPAPSAAEPDCGTVGGSDRPTPDTAPGE